MSLKRYVAKERMVLLPDGENIAVRGLSFNHLSEIVTVHSTEAVKMFDEIVSKDGKLESKIAIGMIEGMLLKFPPILNHIIACATGDSTAIEQAASLPVGTQIEILMAALELTFETSGGVGNLVESAVRIYLNSQGAVQDVLLKAKPLN